MTHRSANEGHNRFPRVISGQPEITRDNLKRYVYIQARIKQSDHPADLGTVVAQVKSVLDQPGMIPAGVRYTLGGMYEQQQLAFAGLVRVNGRVVRELGTSVEAVDVVEFGGRIVAPALEPAYIVMNKPLGVVTTMRDPEGRRTIADVLQGHALERRVVPVGRLDYDTAGVLLLTDDGGLAHVLTHPRFGVEKTYRAMLRGRLTMEQIAALQRGMKLDDGPAQPARLRRFLPAVRREQ